MTSTKTSNGFEFSCDSCGEVWSPPRMGRGSASRDFLESWEDAKKDGWRAKKSPKGEWLHYCEDC